MTPPELDLLDFKRRVHALYARVREDPDPARAFAAWVAERDDLFAHHPQSALPPERRAGFAGLSYFPHDPAGRVLAEVVPDGAAALRRRLQRRRDDVVRAHRRRPLRARRRAVRARALLARRLRRRPVRAVRRRDVRRGDLRRRAATCSTRSRAPTSARATGGWCSTSTSPTTRRAPTTRAGAARSRRRRTASRSRCAWASATSRPCRGNPTPIRGVWPPRRRGTRHGRGGGTMRPWADAPSAAPPLRHPHRPRRLRDRGRGRRDALGGRRVRRSVGGRGRADAARPRRSSRCCSRCSRSPGGRVCRAARAR